VAISRCGKLLSWGWGEEGQLGHGTEKNAYLPRPVRVPRIEGEIGVPVCVAAGMSHSLCVVRNETFVYSPPKPPPVVHKEEAKEELPKAPTQQEMKFYTPAYVESDDEKEEEPQQPALSYRKQAVVADDGEDEEPAAPAISEDEPVVRSIRELLRRKEDAKEEVM
jgi:hypothetical protein